MIEHFCRFNTEATAKTTPALAPYLVTLESGQKVWRGDVATPFRIITGTTSAGTDPLTGQPLLKNVYDTAFYLRLSLPKRDAAVAALTQVIVTDSVDKAEARATAVLEKRGFTDAQIAALKIEPELLGVKNPNE